MEYRGLWNAVNKLVFVELWGLNQSSFIILIAFASQLILKE